jgi:ATP-binding cassette, subfamily F, member 3
MAALGTWNGGVIIISHDERFITSVAKEVRDATAVASMLF